MFKHCSLTCYFLLWFSGFLFMKNHQGSCDLLHTNICRKEIRTLVPAETLNSKKLKFVARWSTWQFEKRNTSTDVIFYFFRSFAALTNLNQTGLTDWITFICLQNPQEPGPCEIQVSCDKKQSILGSCSTILHIPYLKNLLERSTSQICWPFEQHFFR